MYQARDTVRDQVEHVMAVANPMKFAAKGGPVCDQDKGEVKPISGSLAVERDKAFAFLGKVFAAGEHHPEFQISLRMKESERAYYNDKKGDITFGRGDKADTVVHELGHALEDTLSVRGGRLLDRSAEFLDHRVGGEEPTDLARFGMPGEMGRKDRFDEVFGEKSAHYIGKEYKSDPLIDSAKRVVERAGAFLERRRARELPKGVVFGTEVLSMGLQKVYKNPLDFAAKDPEFFNYICGVADGSLR